MPTIDNKIWLTLVKDFSIDAELTHDDQNDALVKPSVKLDKDKPSHESYVQYRSTTPRQLMRVVSAAESQRPQPESKVIVILIDPLVDIQNDQVKSKASSMIKDSAKNSQLITKESTTISEQIYLQCNHQKPFLV
ncbi:hypothetical protein PROFUN_12184 [Planoprotostelium fungivorum]|uniref:Uncharacterized protein n=1 Tax=Planoprotostelium fungivorum TaxID=1890364 RepID=A0A2P6N8H8_9EUKA|nr:hypothetical protein PROFUN_12184 [Planoprotostelium fungivorum]